MMLSWCWSYLRDHGEDVLPRTLAFLDRFPALAKSIYQFVRFSEDRSGVDETVLTFLRNSPRATEYQLFWLGKLMEDFLQESPLYGDLLWTAYNH